MNLAEQVRNIFNDSLFREEEVPATAGMAPEGAVLVEGIVAKYGFHPVRLEAHREEVRQILREMPEPFHKSGGGGMTFLQLCEDKHGNHWAEHPTMEMLVTLAIGLKMGAYCMPKDFWDALPGGMPYVTFDTEI